MNQPLRIGVIGLGNIGRQHIKHIVSGDAGHCVLTAVCSRTPQQNLSGNPKHFSDYRELLSAGCCDAVIVATPTMNHLEIGLAALSQGLHLLMEKPLGLSIGEAQTLIEAKGDRCFALMLNQRTDPRFVAIKRCIDAGEIGDIQRTHWTMTNWFRPDAYFAVSDWRATWRGEGGGLLVNQCIHNLDIFQWLCGMPTEVRGFCAMGKYHPIEVEDEATAWLRYSNGATGTFVGSTGEAPGINRLDIVGTRGTISFDGERVVVRQLESPAPEFCADTRDLFGMPGVNERDITPEQTVNQHATLIANFAAAILDDAPLIAPAEDGLASLSLANAILQSHWEDRAASLPLDPDHYQQLLEQHLATSTLREKADIAVTVDMDKSYR